MAGKNVEKNDFVYANKTQTKIVLEESCEDNPYVCERRYLHGYSNIELAQHKSIADVMLLLFKGELPTANEAKLFEQLMIGLMNLGPRHPANKAAMVAGVSKANVEHLLPIGLSVLGGESNGAREVSASMAFIRANSNKPIESIVNEKTQRDFADNIGEVHIFPGFGNQYGGVDKYCLALADSLSTTIENMESKGYFTWALSLNQTLSYNKMGLLVTGLAAAVFLELGIPEREAVGLFQLMCAPGVFVQGVEQTHLPITAIPMLKDEEYVFQDNNK